MSGSRRATAIRIFLTCWLVYTLHFATNTVREIYPALSLGDHLSFDVSEYLGLHPDIFELPGRGVFINNNPGASILGAIPYALTRPVSDAIVDRFQQQRAAAGQAAPAYDSVYPMAREFYQQTYALGLDVKFGLAAGVMQALLMAPLAALSAVVMFYILLNVGVSARKATLLALLYAFATPVFYRTAQLNHNLLQSHFTLFAFALLWRPGTFRVSRFLLAGLLAGWMLVLDYSGIILLGGLGVYALLQTLHRPTRQWSALFGFGLGALFSVSVLLFYQWAAFGNPFLPAQHYMPATTYSGFGYQGISWPSLALMGELAFGMRYGLFTSAPFLLLALIPRAWTRPDTRLLPKRETLLSLGLCLAFFLFTAANQFSRMQFNTGIRHLVPVVPFLFIIASGLFLRLPGPLAAGFGLLSVYWSWCLAMYRDVELGRGIFEALIQITTGGLRLPWLNTLEHMGYIPGGLAGYILLAAGVIMGAIWLIRPGRGIKLSHTHRGSQSDTYSA